MRNVLLSSVLSVLLATASLTSVANPMGAAANPMAAETMPLGAEAMAGQAQQVADKININTADALTLQKALSGVGLNKANAIVAYRESNGNFTSVDELIEVSGIGKTLLDRNRDKLAIE
ncbi:helix-hairpin-helix domain-containing protein [Pseudomonas sp. LJDD11]|uniref:ComEA family DNA-binding protein n=1 Tax=unclassified Pseudomonas TaxID=196821 RepID=UPI0004F61512|nr:MULTISPECIES: helix-hairpin-helix domain-containing protein [unclassified Pseudomonas]MCQ9425143.1 helix-hairpin-helix domain-containing protein [Pseudomonas sp. LJDD11]BAP41037.1 competence protein ComEA helix-hairpin-helix region [Pseudomonas sp. StFLB209]